MRLSLKYGLLVAFAGLSVAQNCPYLGPAYPAATSADAPAFVSASGALDKALADAIASGKIDGATSKFAIQVYLGNKKPIYASYHTPTVSNGTRSGAVVGSDTVFRAYSISKLITVYTILTKLGDKYWDEPVAKYVPEISRLSGGNPVYDADWEEITLGSLASLMSGIGRDYSLGDFSIGDKSNLTGFRELIDFEEVKCGAEGQKACSRAEAIQAMLSVYPLTSAFNTPTYSNMAFQLLAYAVETITGTPFSDLVKRQVIEPLGLKRTFLATPSNLTTDVAIASGWEHDFGDEAPSTGYYLSAGDLSTIGASILSSSLIPAKLTRKWLKPLTHTSSLVTSLGRPWEIVRSRVPVSAGSKTTRIVDVYTKQGGGGESDAYTSLIALSPAHNLGISILTAGSFSHADFKTIKSLVLDTFLAAAELAAREEAKKNYAARYILNNNSTVEIILRPDEAGLAIGKFTSQGVDMLARFGNLTTTNSGKKMMSGEGSKLGAWLYPMGLTGRAFAGTEVAFRATVGVLGVPTPENCASWAQSDRIRWGRYPGDLALFGVAGGGEVGSVNFPLVSERSYRREGREGDTIFGPFEPGE